MWRSSVPKPLFQIELAQPEILEEGKEGVANHQ
jgi:hypothetical protein